MNTWRVCVEDQFGIVAVHFVDSVFQSSATESEQAKGFKVLSVTKVGS